MAEVSVEFRRLDLTGFGVGVPPVIDVELSPLESFDVNGRYLDGRMRRYRWYGRGYNDVEGTAFDNEFVLNLDPNEEVVANSRYVVTVRFGARKRRFTIKVPTTAEAVTANLSEPYRLKDLIDLAAE